MKPKNHGCADVLRWTQMPDWFYSYAIGAFYIEIGEIRLALKFLRRAVKRRPVDPCVREAYAHALEEAGSGCAANEYLKAAMLWSKWENDEESR